MTSRSGPSLPGRNLWATLWLAWFISRKDTEDVDRGELLDGKMNHGSVGL